MTQTPVKHFIKNINVGASRAKGKRALVQKKKMYKKSSKHLEENLINQIRNNPSPKSDEIIT